MTYFISNRVSLLTRSPAFKASIYLFGTLWHSAGLDYRHGTGHGVGAFLNVHEKGVVRTAYKKQEKKIPAFVEKIIQKTRHRNFNTENKIKKHHTINKRKKGQLSSNTKNKNKEDQLL